MSTLDNRVQNALPHQDSSAKEEFRMIREKFDEKHQEIYKLYTDSLIWSYTETLTEELGGLVMIVRRYGQPEKHGGRYLWNARIRLPLRTRNQQEKGYSLARRKIDTLLELLNWYHNLFSLNGLDREILGREEGNHGKLLEWFYEQLFVDTDDHPLLLGEAKVGGQEPNPKKTFTTAQKRLYETLVGTARLAGLEAVRLAFDLLELWYRAEFSSLSTRPFSAVDYPAQLLQAVRNYPPRYPTHKMAKQRVLH
ncbi:hypothetical protein PTTG_07283 [Puccinia triticina 1-1 BBBD Race 1]|uniref:Uncharacterized protein n=1 Tax=Puccinia triticina (isolate 1-1 / race 1 (BBBD)) TaxID=630390 RepID=A0A0C4F2G2_PUCT1|nr:hypothetical protein PTTG_07283 [Puccinia triticina 1-1 BBBD Race 1]